MGIRIEGEKAGLHIKDKFLDDVEGGYSSLAAFLYMATFDGYYTINFRDHNGSVRGHRLPCSVTAQ